MHAALPKPLLEVAGETLLGRSARLLHSRGVERTIVVAGYLAERFAPLAAARAEIELVVNHGYATGGSLSSLAAGIEALGRADDFLVLEGDLYYEARALDVLAAERASVGLMTAPTGAGDEVWVDAPGGLLRGLSKDPGALGGVDGEMVGIWRLDRQAAGALVDLYRSGPSRGSRDYENGLVAVARQVVISMRMEPDLLWGEVDDASQLSRVRRHLVPRIVVVEHLDGAGGAIRAEG